MTKTGRIDTNEGRGPVQRVVLSTDHGRVLDHAQRGTRMCEIACSTIGKHVLNDILCIIL